MASVIGLGEVLWDCFQDNKKPGGAPANVAYHVQQMGLTGLVAARVGQDDLGGQLLQHLTVHDLSTSLVQEDPDKPTGTVDVQLSAQGKATFVIREDVAWDHLELSPAWRAAASEAAAICFGTLAQRSTNNRTVIQAMLRDATQAIRVCDVNLRRPWYDAEVVASSLNLATVAKFNDEEAPILAHLLRLPAGGVPEIARNILRRFDLQLVCVTRGEHGCLLVESDGDISIPGSEIDVADTVGAGDAFTAAVIFALIQAWSLDRVADFANRVGALVASRAGAMPPVREEYQELIEALTRP